MKTTGQTRTWLRATVLCSALCAAVVLLGADRALAAAVEVDARSAHRAVWKVYGGGKSGTAFPIGDRHFLTCAHVIKGFADHGAKNVFLMAEAPRILLEHHLKKLKLPTFLREYEKLARQCAAEGLDHVRFLARLVEMEMIDRERRLVERRIRQARFPVVKQLESFDFKAIPSLNKMLVLDLARGDYIDRRENAILLGPSSPSA